MEKRPVKTIIRFCCISGRWQFVGKRRWHGPVRRCNSEQDGRHTSDVRRHVCRYGVWRRCFAGRCGQQFCVNSRLSHVISYCASGVILWKDWQHVGFVARRCNDALVCSRCRQNITVVNLPLKVVLCHDSLERLWCGGAVRRKSISIKPKKHTFLWLLLSHCGPLIHLPPAKW